MPFPLFFGLLLVIQFIFGWAASNMNSLSMEPLGNVAGTAASVFGFTQTVGGALIGTYHRPAVQRHPGAQRHRLRRRWALLVLICMLIAEKGKLFGVGPQYEQPGRASDAGH